MADWELNRTESHGPYCDVLEALASADDISEVMSLVYPLIARLIPSDYAAFGVSRSGRLEDYEWTVAALPQSFFAAYAELAPHDFVRDSVVRVPNRALRDEDMIARPSLEANPLYRRAREVGAPIEQVVAVMLHADEQWQGGLSLYRERRHPFTEHERAALQRLSPALAATLRRCQLLTHSRDLRAALEILLTEQQGALLVTTGAGYELQRSAGATALLERWFVPSERVPGSLPAPLLAALGEFSRPLGAAPRAWSRRLANSVLNVQFTELSRLPGGERWLLRLHERSLRPPLPRPIASRLTPREREVVGGIAQGWDNRLIADELGCAEATVKRHIQNVFGKLGLGTRAALQARIHELERTES